MVSLWFCLVANINFNTIYQATTDGYLVGSVYLRGGISGVQYGQAYFYTSQTSPPSSSPEAAIQIYLYQAPGINEWCCATI